MFSIEFRRAFLEFLRNLTPQILFLTVALVIGTEVNLHDFQPNVAGIKNVVSYFLCLAVLLAAYYANTTSFFDTCYLLLPKRETESPDNKELQPKGWKKISNFWRKSKAIFLLAMLILVVSSSGLVAVALTAKHGAVAVVKAML